jgi:hypothetical protein
MNEHQFLVMWDMYGLEYCEDLTEISQSIMWSKLREETAKVRIPNLMHLQLRAQYNTHRHYEIYVVSAEPGVTKEDIIQMFEDHPQGAAELVRENGHCFRDDRPKQKAVIS